jgi:hypothetical protein
MFLVVIYAIDESRLIPLSEVAAMGLTLIVLGIFLPGLIEVVTKFRDRHGQKKYDTGTLAQIELEA